MDGGVMFYAEFLHSKKLQDKKMARMSIFYQIPPKTGETQTLFCFPAPFNYGFSQSERISRNIAD
jgi:hypothetical protein